MLIEKRKFIEQYIVKLENQLSRYTKSRSNSDLEEMFDLIIEIAKVFKTDLPQIENAVDLKEYTGVRDANCVINILKLYLIEQSGIVSKSIDIKIEPIIFLSHSSKDKKFTDSLVKFMTGLGVTNKQIICTSHPLHKIPLDMNIFDYLRESITKDVFVMILWSNDYLNSPACLSEMGAAWVAQKNFSNLYTPDFDFGNPRYYECAVDTKKMGAVLNGNENCKTSILELKNKIAMLFNLSIDEAKSVFLIDQLINEIKDYQKESAV